MEILHEKGLKVLKFKSEVATDDAKRPPVTVNSSSAAIKRRNKRDEDFISRILYLIIAVLLVLIVRDVYQVTVLRRKTLEKERYVKAVRSSSDGWTTGWKLEELQSKLVTQNTVLRSLMLKLHAPFLSTFLRGNKGEGLSDIEADVVTDLMTHVENVTAMHTWTCVTSPNTFLRVGPVDFFDATPENCLVHSAGERVGPSSIFEVVPLGDGFVGFRSFVNGKFVKVTPPASGKSSDPWWLDLASPVPGLAERFRLEQGRLVFNELLQGYVKCGGSSATTALGAPIQGVPGSKPDDVQFKPEFQFTLHKVTGEHMAHARVLKAAAKTLERQSSSQFTAFLEASKIKLQYESFTAKEALQKEGAKIAVVIPVTSKDTNMDSVGESPFFRNTLASFLQTIDWRTNRFSYTFFLGFDQGDALYDTGDAWSDMRQAFQSAVEMHMTGMYGRGDSTADLRHTTAQQLSLRLKHFREKEGAPSQVVSELVQDAYEDGYDYFFQVNDDTVFQTKDWPTIFTSTLAESPLYANLGVIGPYDLTNPRILTHAFVHRTHLDIFDGHFFPEVFKNWWSDDWISAVYGRHATFRSHSVTVLHNVHSQKKGSTVQRYKVDESAQLRLRAQVLHAMAKVNAFLVSHGRPRLPLPEVCGYVPLVEELYSHLQQEAGEAEGEAAQAALAAQKVREQNMVQYEVQKHPPAHSAQKHQAGRLHEDLDLVGPPKGLSTGGTGGGRNGEGEQGRAVFMPERDAYWGKKGQGAHVGGEAGQPRVEDRVLMRELDEGGWARGQEKQQDVTVEDLADADW